MVSLVKCAGCGQRCIQRPITVYWRWTRADGVNKSYRQRVCGDCYAVKVLAMDLDYAAVERLTCPACGIDTEDDYDAVYVSAFEAKNAQHDLEFPLCGVHAAELRVWVIDHAVDTDGDVGADRPPRDAPRTSSPGAAETLRALGRPSGVR